MPLGFRSVVRRALAALACACAAAAQGQSCQASHAEEFRVELKRVAIDEVVDNGHKTARIYGDVGVNGQNIGRFYENPQLRIEPGIYKGVLRYQSNHNFVQSSCGEMAREGDYLLEVAEVRGADGAKRSDILLHPGFKPSHSKGCVLLGARKRGTDGKPLPLAADEPLVKMRRAFYGTDNPIACPNKRIVIVVTG